MFTRISPTFTIRHSAKAHKIATSPKRPVLFIYHDDCLLEMSLITREIKLIQTLMPFSIMALICDVDDNLYVYGYLEALVTSKRYVYRFTFSNDRWSHIELQEEDLEKVRYSLGLKFVNISLCDLRKLNCNDYSIIGADQLGISRDTHLKLSNDCTLLDPDLRWITSYGKDRFLMCVDEYKYDSPKKFCRLLVLTDNVISPLASYVSIDHPQLMYSPVTREIYGLSVPSSFNPYWHDRSGECYISVYNYEVLSLFSCCSRALRHSPKLLESIPPCIREQMNDSKTERAV